MPIGLEMGFLLLAAVLVASIAFGLYGIIRVSQPADVMLGVLLVGTTGTATTLLLGVGLRLERVADVALVFALLASILGVAFVLCGWSKPGEPRRGPGHD